MQVILSKEDIETIIKEHFDMESVTWKKDGTIVIDSTLEKITNEENDQSVFESIIRKDKENEMMLKPSPYTMNPGILRSSRLKYLNHKKHLKEKRQPYF